MMMVIFCGIKKGTNIIHREDGPAIEFANGDKYWFRMYNLHREDGPAQEYVDGDKRWYQNGKLHRLDGPAIENANGHKIWYQYGIRHRVDGPAVEHLDGYKEWWIKGQLYSKTQFKQIVKENNCDGKEVVFEGKKYKLSLVDKK